MRQNLTDRTQNSPAVGSVHTLTPHDLAVDGGGVGRLAGMAVFLDRGLPGETLRCRVTETKPRFLRAEVLETLSPSPDETPSFCPHAARCGGCAWTNLRYAAQLAWKERHVRETLRRIGKVAFDMDGAGPEYLPITPSPRVTGYRNKMEFAFGTERGSPALGLRERASHEIVSVEECALCFQPVAPILAVGRAWMRENALAPFDGRHGLLRFLVVRTPEYTPDGTARCLVECITAPASAGQARMVRELGRRLLAETTATGFMHTERAAASNVAYGEKAVYSEGETLVTERFGALELRAPAQAFMQANVGAATLLYSHIRAYAAEQARVIWDFYCGVGGIALSLAREGVTVRGVETAAEAVRFARKNAAGAPGDVAFFQGDAGALTEEVTPRPDLAVTDPPRAGMAAGLIHTLLRLRPRRIIAAGCDAASLARDVARLAPVYELKSARAIDLFPHTPHVEIAALLELSSRKT